MKRLLYCLLFTIVLSALMGCGANATPTTAPSPVLAAPTSTPPPAAPSTTTAPTSTPVVRTPGTLLLATTTSTQDSGLLDYLLPFFEKQYNVKVKVVAVGTGQALK